MTDTDMMIAIRQNGQVAIWDMWSTSHDPPQQDIAIQGCHMDLVLVSQNFTNGVMYAVFNRFLDTKDPNCDRVLQVDVTTPVCYAYLDSESFDEHQNYGQGTAVFGSTDSSSSLSVSTGYGSDYETHGILLGLAWGFCAPLSILLARYGKKYCMWFYIHALFGWFALIATLYSATYIYKEDKNAPPTLSGKVAYHFRLGLTVASLVFATVVLGGTSKLWIRSATLRILPLRFFRTAHKALGYTTTVLALIAVYYGLDLYDSSKDWVLYMDYSVVFAAFAVLEGNLRYPKVIKSFWRWKVTRTYAYEDFHYRVDGYSFLDEWVLHTSPFAESHPGGEVIVRKTVSQDIGKYIVGNIGFSQSCVGYVHSKYARTLARQLRVGRIQFQEGIIVGKVSTANLRRTEWKIVEKQEEAGPNIARFSLQSESHKAATFCAGVEWMGKHFRVTAKVDGRKTHRYYSLVLCLNRKVRGRWAASAHKQNLDVPLRLQSDRASDSSQYDNLDLVIKNYPTGQFSSHVHSLPLGSALWLKGPMGPGLRLSKAATGHHAAYAAGTGLLPFLDLVHLLWWKELGGEEYLLDSATLEGFDLKLFVFAASREEVVAVHLLEATHALCAATARPRFRLVLSVDQPKEEREGTVVAGVTEDLKRVWVCGPTGFNDWVEALLKAKGVDEKLIFPF